MAYTALYREFRPKTFGEMVGQEHITKTLKNQIMSNRVGPVSYTHLTLPTTATV